CLCFVLWATPLLTHTVYSHTLYTHTHTVYTHTHCILTHTVYSHTLYTHTHCTLYTHTHCILTHTVHCILTHTVHCTLTHTHTHTPHGKKMPFKCRLFQQKIALKCLEKLWPCTACGVQRSLR